MPPAWNVFAELHVSAMEVVQNAKDTKVIGETVMGLVSSVGNNGKQP